MIVRGPFNALLRPGLRRDFRDSYNSFPEEYSRILAVGTQDRAEVEAVALSGLPQMPVRTEAAQVTFLDPAVSAKRTYIDDEYALGFEISKRMVEDDLYGKAHQNAKWLGRSARLTQEYLAASLLNDAFAGSTFTGLTSEALCSTSHTFVGASGTWSNRISGDTQFGVTGVQAAFELAENQKDHNGYPMPIMINDFVINIADEWAAIAILNSEKEPYTTDNQVNAIRRKRANMQYMVSHYKTQGSGWFARDMSLQDAHFLFRVKPEFDDGYEKKTLNAFYIARQRIMVYFFDQRGWIGSNS